MRSPRGGRDRRAGQPASRDAGVDFQVARRLAARATQPAQRGQEKPHAGLRSRSARPLPQTRLRSNRGTCRRSTDTPLPETALSPHRHVTFLPVLDGTASSRASAAPGPSHHRFFAGRVVLVKGVEKAEAPRLPGERRRRAPARSRPRQLTLRYADPSGVRPMPFDRFR